MSETLVIENQNKTCVRKQTNLTMHLVCKEPRLYFKMENCFLREVIIKEKKNYVSFCVTMLSKCNLFEVLLQKV